MEKVRWRERGSDSRVEVMGVPLEEEEGEGGTLSHGSNSTQEGRETIKRH